MKFIKVTDFYEDKDIEVLNTDTIVRISTYREELEVELPKSKKGGLFDSDDAETEVKEFTGSEIHFNDGETLCVAENPSKIFSMMYDVETESKNAS
jgi:hypothetical protein